MEQLKEFQKKIGYQFQQEGLLRQALTYGCAGGGTDPCASKYCM
mgnify:CR=1 FL=1